MLEKFVASLVTTYLGRYVSNIDRDSINLSLWHGDAVLKNLELRPSALDQLNLPLTIARGTIGLIQLKIPWSRLSYESIRVVVEDVDVFVVPVQAAAYSEEDYRAKQWERKQDALQIFEMLRTQQQQQQVTSLPPGDDNDIENDSDADAGLVERLRRSIINNIDITIKKVCIRYSDDCVTHPGRQLTATMSFGAFRVHTVDPSTGEATFAGPNTATVHKTATLTDFAFHIDVVDNGSSSSSSSISIDDLSRLPRDKWRAVVQAPLTHAVITPTSADVSLEYQPRLTDPTRPKLNVRCLVTRPNISLSRPQYDAMWAMWRYIQKYPRLEVYQQFRPRPGERPSTHPCAWWRYAIACVRHEVRAMLCQKYIMWPRIVERAKNKRTYLDLYYRAQEPPWLSTRLQPDEVEALDALEHALDVEDIIHYRRLVYAKLRLESERYDVHKARRAEKKKEAVYETKQTWRGWITYYSGLSGSGLPQDKDHEEGWNLLDARVWDEHQRAALYATMGMDATDADIANEPSAKGADAVASYLGTVFSLTVSEGCVCFVGYSAQGVATLNYADFCLRVESALESFQTSVTVGSYQLVDDVEGAVVVQPMSQLVGGSPKSDGENDDDDDFAIHEHIVIKLARNSASEYSVEVALDPVDITTRITFLQRLIGFWGFGSSAAYLGDVVSAPSGHSASSASPHTHTLELELQRRADQLWSVDVQTHLEAVSVTFLAPGYTPLPLQIEGIQVKSQRHVTAPTTDWFKRNKITVRRVCLGSLMESALDIEACSLLVPENDALPNVELVCRIPAPVTMNLSKRNMYELMVLTNLLLELSFNSGGRGVHNVEQAADDDDTLTVSTRGPCCGSERTCLASDTPTERLVTLEDRVLQLHRVDRASAAYAVLEFTSSDFDLDLDPATHTLHLRLPQGGFKYDPDVADEQSDVREMLEEAGIKISETTSGTNFDDMRRQVSTLDLADEARRPCLLDAVASMERHQNTFESVYVELQFKHVWEYQHFVHKLTVLRDGPATQRWATMRPESCFGALDYCLRNRFVASVTVVAPRVDIVFDPSVLNGVASPQQTMSVVSAEITVELFTYDKIITVEADSVLLDGALVVGSAAPNNKNNSMTDADVVDALPPSYDDTTRPPAPGRFHLSFSDLNAMSPTFSELVSAARKQLRVYVPTVDLTLGLPLVTFVESLWDVLQIVMQGYERYYWFQTIPHVHSVHELEQEKLRYEMFSAVVEMGAESSATLCEVDGGTFAKAVIGGGSTVSFLRYASGEHVTKVRLADCTFLECIYPESRHREVIEGAKEMVITYSVRPNMMARDMGFKYTHYMTMAIDGGRAMYRQVFIWSLLEYFSSGILTRLTYASWRGAFDGQNLGAVPYETYSRTELKTKAGRELLKLDITLKNLDTVLPPTPDSEWVFTGHVDTISIANALRHPTDGVLRSDIDIDLAGVTLTSCEEGGRRYNIVDGAQLFMSLRTEFVNPLKLIPEKALILSAANFETLITNVGLQRVLKLLHGCIMEPWVPRVAVPAPWPPAFTLLDDKKNVCFYEWHFTFTDVVVRGVELGGTGTAPVTWVRNVVLADTIDLTFDWFNDGLFDTRYKIHGLEVHDVDVELLRQSDPSMDDANPFHVTTLIEKYSWCVVGGGASPISLLDIGYAWHNAAKRLTLTVDVSKLRANPFPAKRAVGVKDFWVTLDVRNALAPILGWPAVDAPPPPAIPGYSSTLDVRLIGLTVLVADVCTLHIGDAALHHLWTEERELWKCRLVEGFNVSNEEKSRKEVLRMAAVDTTMPLLEVIYEGHVVGGSVQSVVFTYLPHTVQQLVALASNPDTVLLSQIGMYGADREAIKTTLQVEDTKTASTDDGEGPPMSPRSRMKLRRAEDVLRLDVTLRHPILIIPVNHVDTAGGLLVDCGVISLTNSLVRRGGVSQFEQFSLEVAGFCITTMSGGGSDAAGSHLLSRVDASLTVAQALDVFIPDGLARLMIVARLGQIHINMSMVNYQLLLQLVMQYVYAPTATTTQTDNTNSHPPAAVEATASNELTAESAEKDLLEHTKQLAAHYRVATSDEAATCVLLVDAEMPQLFIEIPVERERDELHNNMSSTGQQQTAPIKVCFDTFSSSLRVSDLGEISFSFMLHEASIREPATLFSTSAEPGRHMTVEYGYTPHNNTQCLSVDLASSEVLLEPNAFAPLWNFFYLNYCLVMMPHLGDAEVLEIEDDWTLEANLVLSPHRVVRIRNTRNNFIKIFGGLHAIHFLAPRGSGAMPLITIDDGVTLHIVQSQLFLYRSELTDHIRCGNGSYFVADDAYNTFHRTRAAHPGVDARALSRMSTRLGEHMRRTVIKAQGALTTRLPGSSGSGRRRSILVSLAMTGEYSWTSLQNQLVEENGRFDLTDYRIVTERERAPNGEVEQTFILEPVSLQLRIEGQIAGEYARTLTLSDTGDFDFTVRYSDLDLLLEAVRRLQRSLRGSASTFALRRDVGAIEAQLQPATEGGATTNTAILLTDVHVTHGVVNLHSIGLQLLDDTSGTDVPLFYVTVDNICTPTFDVTTLSKIIRLQSEFHVQFFNEETCEWSVLLQRTKSDLGVKHEIPATFGELSKRRFGVFKFGFLLDPGINLEICPMAMRTIRRTIRLSEMLKHKLGDGPGGGLSAAAAAAVSVGVHEYKMFHVINDSGLDVTFEVPEIGLFDLKTKQDTEFNFPRGIQLSASNQLVKLTIGRTRQEEVNIGQVGCHSIYIGSGWLFVVDVGLKHGRKRVVFRSTVTIHNQLDCAVAVKGVGEIPCDGVAAVSFDTLDRGRFEVKPVKEGYEFGSAMLGAPYYLMHHLVGMSFTCTCDVLRVVGTPKTAERCTYMGVAIKHHGSLPHDTRIVIAPLLAITNTTGARITVLLYDRSDVMVAARKESTLSKLFRRKQSMLRPFDQFHLESDSACKVTHFDECKELWMEVELEQPNGCTLKRPARGDPVLIRTHEDRKVANSIVLIDDDGRSLVLCIDYSKDRREIVVFCPYWIVNQTQHYLQVSDDRMRHGLTGGQCKDEGIPPGGVPFLLNTPGFEDSDPLGHALTVRIGRLHNGSLDFGLWSKVAIPLASTGDYGHICSNVGSTGMALTLGWVVEYAANSELKYTKVLKFTPRWVIINRTLRTLLFRLPRAAGVVDFVMPGNNFTVDFSSTKTHEDNMLEITYQDDDYQHLQQPQPNKSPSGRNRGHGDFSKPLNIDHQLDTSLNLKYNRTVSVSPKRRAAEVGGGASTSLFLDDDDDAVEEYRQEFDVIRVTVYRRESVQLIACDLIQRPPYCIENRTSFRTKVQQHGSREVLTLHPRTTRGFVWDDPNKPPMMKLDVYLPGVDGKHLCTFDVALGAHHHSQSKSITGPNGTSQRQQFHVPSQYGAGYVYLRVRAHQHVHYVSLTRDNHIDQLLALPFANRHLSFRIESLGVLVRGRIGDMVYLYARELQLTHIQGGGRDGGRDMEQTVQLRVAHVQIDDERPESTQPVAVVAHTRTASDVERFTHFFDLTAVRHLDRSTPHMHMRTIELRLSPITAHIDDEFLYDLMIAFKELSTSDTQATSSSSSVQRTTATPAGGSSVYHGTPWVEELRQPAPSESSILYQVWSVEYLKVDAIVLFFSLYRRRVGAKDPFRNVLGLFSAILRTTKDVRLVWRPVRKDLLSDKMWLLATYFRDYYMFEFLKQFFQIINVPGMSSLRHMVTELVDCYPTTTQDASATMHSYWSLNAVVKPRRPKQSNSKKTAPMRGEWVVRSGGSTKSESEILLSVLPRPDPRHLQHVNHRNFIAGKCGVELYVHTAQWDEFVSVFSHHDTRFSPERFFDLSDTLLVNFARRNVCNPSLHNATYDRCKRCEYVEDLKRRLWYHKGRQVVLPIPGVTSSDIDLEWHEFAHHTTWLEFKTALRADPDLFLKHVRMSRDNVLVPSRNVYVSSSFAPITPNRTQSTLNQK
eukprot:PhM_4_TR11251/c0_g1_i1/m.70043/K19525/VPS13A_C; vacuolar protein sorting-associated protein 13A/C